MLSLALLTSPRGRHAASVTAPLKSTLSWLSGASLLKLDLDEKTCSSGAICVDIPIYTHDERPAAVSPARIPARRLAPPKSTSSPFSAALAQKSPIALPPVLTTKIEQSVAITALRKVANSGSSSTTAHEHLSRSTGLAARPLPHCPLTPLAEWDWTKDTVPAPLPRVEGLTRAGRRKMAAIRSWLHKHSAHLDSPASQRAAYTHGVTLVQQEEPREREAEDSERRLPRHKRTVDYSRDCTARRRIVRLMNGYLADFFPSSAPSSPRASRSSSSPRSPSPLASECTSALRAPAPRRVRFTVAPECKTRRPNLSAVQLCEAAADGRGARRFALLNAAALRCAAEAAL
ncbi:hypothetical protein JCM10450v2_000062 [Rhodotorula kratochvilovae]